MTTFCVQLGVCAAVGAVTGHFIAGWSTYIPPGADGIARLLRCARFVSFGSRHTERRRPSSGLASRLRSPLVLVERMSGFIVGSFTLPDIAVRGRLVETFRSRGQILFRLFPVVETRHFRQSPCKPLITLAELLSGWLSI